MLLLAIADCANDQGEAFPSLALLGQKSCMSKSTVIRVLRALEGDGWFAVRRRAVQWDGDSHPRGNLYAFALGKLRLAAPQKQATVREPRGVTVKPHNANGEVSKAGLRGVTMTPHDTGCEVSKQGLRGVKREHPPTPPFVGEPSEPSQLPPPTPSAEGELREAELLEAIEIQRRLALSTHREESRAALTEKLRLQAELVAGRKANAQAVPSKGPERVAATTPPEGSTLDEQATWVMARCGFSGPESVRQAVRTTLAVAGEAERPARAAAMAEAWLQYVRGPSRWSAQNFFRLGHWQHPASWPQGTRPFDPCATQERAMA